MNNSIWVGEKSFDIGCRIIKWNEPEGLNLIPYKKYGSRPADYLKLKNSLSQFTTHWSATYTAKDTYVGLIGRNLSVNFIIEDDCNSEGYATIYQCLPIELAGWSQGNGMNTLGAGVEISYQPAAWEGNKYTDEICKKHNVNKHDIIIAPIHGTKLKVYLPTEAQMNSLIQLIWGYCELFPKIKTKFPRDSKGNYLNTVLQKPLD